MFIGRKIKELRKIKKLSLSDLAQKSSVQIATLSRIEHEKMTGTLESHIKIAQALDIDLPTLYSAIERETSSKTVSISKPSADVFAYNTLSSFEILTPKVLGKKMMPILLKIEPKGKTQIEKLEPGSEKFVFVLIGTINVKVGEKTQALTSNHTLYLDASLPHQFINKSHKTAKIICVSTPVTL